MKQALVVAVALTFHEAKAVFSMDCYVDSTEWAGYKQGTSVTDRGTMTTNFETLKETHRSAAIKTCTRKSDGTLLGT
jgi:hypothetical protein